jgi:hypothetical protein
MESRHHFQHKGALAEAVVHSLATETFFTDWCYPNPRKPDGKELCDLLVVFDDTAIIWQIKDLKTNENGRYKAAEVEKNLRQLGGARRTLFDLRTPITLSNPRRGNELFAPDSIRHVHLISVLMGEGEEPMPLMPEIKGHLLHVFTRKFADIALSELDTVSDFCRYLRAKESINKSKQLKIQGGEENLLGKYIEMGRNFEWVSAHDRIMLDGTIWETIGTMPQYIEKKELDRISYGWDSIIERVHEGSARYEVLARELARPDRFTRRILAKHFMEAYSGFMLSGMPLYRRQFPLLDTTYCFLITDEIQRPSERNLNMLRAMCFVARGLNADIPRVLGVATTGANQAYDFCFLNKKTWSPQDEAIMRKVQKEYGIFASPRRTEAGEDEYPPPSS